MSSSHLLRAAIATLGVFVSTAPLARAQASADGTAPPTVTTQTSEDSVSTPFDAQRCRYKPLPGSHIKVHVCTSREGIEYRMDRRARTNAVVIGGPVGEPVAAPLPQVQ